MPRHPAGNPALQSAARWSVGKADHRVG